MLFPRNTWIFVQFALWMGYCMSYFHLHVFVWMISCFFVSYDKFLAMWVVTEFFRFSKVESVSAFFFSLQLLLSDWYYCVICVLAAKKVCSCEKSRLVENRLQSSLFYFVFELLHIVFSKLVLLISVTTLTSGIFTHTTTNVSLTLSMAAWVWMLPLTKNQFHHRCSLDVFGNLHASCFKNTPEHLLSLSARLSKSSHRRFFIKRFS